MSWNSVVSAIYRCELSLRLLDTHRENEKKNYTYTHKHIRPRQMCVSCWEVFVLPKNVTVSFSVPFFFFTSFDDTSWHKLAQIKFHRWKVFGIDAIKKMIHENKHNGKCLLEKYSEKKKRQTLDFVHAKNSEKRREKKRDVLWLISTDIWVYVCLFFTNSVTHSPAAAFARSHTVTRWLNILLRLRPIEALHAHISSVTVFVCRLVWGIFQIDTKWHTATIAAYKLLYMQIAEHFFFSNFFFFRIKYANFRIFII